MKHLLIIGLLAFIALLLHHEIIEKPRLAHEQERAVEINRHRLLMARSNGYDTSDFDGRDYDDNGWRIDGVKPTTAPAAVTPKPPPPRYQTAEEAAALVAQAMATPRPTPGRALTPAEQNAEIARKYGTR